MIFFFYFLLSKKEQKKNVYDNSQISAQREFIESKSSEQRGYKMWMIQIKILTPKSNDISYFLCHHKRRKKVDHFHPPSCLGKTLLFHINIAWTSTDASMTTALIFYKFIPADLTSDVALLCCGPHSDGCEKVFNFYFISSYK